ALPPFFFPVAPRPPSSTLFPYTTLFRSAALDRPLPGALNDWTVGHWVRKRNTQLNDVSARLDQGMHQGRSGLHGRLTRRNVGNQCRTVAGLGERGGQPIVRGIHGLLPYCSTA